MRTFVIASALALLLAGQAAADTGTMTIEGTGAGTLGDVPFEGMIRFEAAYDTNTVKEIQTDPLNPDLRWWIAPILYAAVSTAAGQVDILDDGEVLSYSHNHLVAPPSGLLMAFPTVRTTYFTVDGGLGDPFLNYDLSYTFGPVQLGFGPPPSVGYPRYVIATSEGELVLEGGRQDLYDWTGYVEVVP